MRVTILINESETLKEALKDPNKFVTGTVNDGNLTKQEFYELLQGLLGEYVGLIASKIPDDVELEKPDVDPGPEA